MIQANVRSTQTMVNQRATEIRFKELTLFTDNLGVIASLAAFFAETSLESLYIEPETVSKESATNHFSTLAWILSSVTISLNLLTLLVAIYTMLHGPALARREARLRREVRVEMLPRSRAARCEGAAYRSKRLEPPR